MGNRKPDANVAIRNTTDIKSVQPIKPNANLDSDDWWRIQDTIPTITKKKKGNEGGTDEIEVIESKLTYYFRSTFQIAKVHLFIKYMWLFVANSISMFTFLCYHTEMIVVMFFNHVQKRQNGLVIPL